MKKSLLSICGLMLLAVGGGYFLFAADGVAREATTITVASGAVSGVLEGETAVYRGIPYAAPPVGELRWRAPRAAEPWSGVLDASEFGAVCPQPPRPARPIALPQDEDCLTLNIWAPAQRGAALPVMVWIHGGAFQLGSGAQPFYDGAALSESGVVVVTFNYRLGKLGFFAHPALSQEHDLHYPEELEGNYGLMDQLAALRWVQDNIGQFGGDPDNVTIFGESAGAVSVNYLLTSELAQGLFHKAISQSGGGFQRALPLRGRDVQRRPSLEEAGAAWGETVALPAGADAAALRALPVDTVVPQERIKSLGVGPVIDGRLVAGDIGRRFKEGKVLNVPYLVGANDYEASLMKATGMSDDRIFDFFGADKDRAVELYRREGIAARDQLLHALYGDATFVAPARYLADHASAAGQPTWHYHFSYVPLKLREKVPGAAHGSEIPFVFGTLSQMKAARLWLKSADEQVSSTMLSYWRNFARNGDPNGSGLPLWAPFKADDRNTMAFAADGPRTQKNLYQRRLDFHAERYDKALLTPAEARARALAEEAYVFFYPMLQNYKTLYTRSVIQKRPINTFTHRRKLLDPSFKMIVGPNNDTLYSAAWFDLRSEPVVISVPPVPQSRYYSIQFIDLNVYNFGYIGQRVTGPDAGTYVLAGPGQEVPKIPGIKGVLRSESSLVFAIVRILADGAGDQAAVTTIQDQLTVRPLSEVLATDPPPAPAPLSLPPYDAQAIQTPAFIGIVNTLLPLIDYPADEKDRIAAFGSIGIGSSPEIAFEALPENIQRAVQEGVDDAFAAITEASRMIGTEVDGWSTTFKGFGPRSVVEGQDLTRAAAAKLALYGNDKEENSSYTRQKDDAGNFLDGSKATYTLTFNREDLPPAEAFWSLTLYELPGVHFYDNAIDRYSIGDRTEGLSWNDDGSLTLYLQHERPEAARVSNWLPAPAGEFAIALRMYRPRPAVYTGQWQPPALVKHALRD